MALPKRRRANILTRFQYSNSHAAIVFSKSNGAESSDEGQRAQIVLSSEKSASTVQPGSNEDFKSDPGLKRHRNVRRKDSVSPDAPFFEFQKNSTLPIRPTQTDLISIRQNQNSLVARWLFDGEKSSEFDVPNRNSAPETRTLDMIKDQRPLIFEWEHAEDDEEEEGSSRSWEDWSRQYQEVDR